MAQRHSLPSLLHCTKPDISAKAIRICRSPHHPRPPRSFRASFVLDSHEVSNLLFCSAYTPRRHGITTVSSTNCCLCPVIALNVVMQKSFFVGRGEHRFRDNAFSCLFRCWLSLQRCASLVAAESSHSPDFSNCGPWRA